MNNKSTPETNYLNRGSGILPTEYGFYHNEAVNLYLDELDKTGRKFSDQKISTAIVEMADLMEQKYPSVFGNVDINLILDYYSDYTYVEDYGYNSLKNNVISTFSDRNKNSQKFISFLTDIYQNNDITYEEILEELNNESDNSKEFLVFEDVLKASHSLWSSFPNSQSSRVYDQCGTGSIIVDAGIAALLCWNPFGAAVGAGMGSAIYNENCHAGNP